MDQVIEFLKEVNIAQLFIMLTGAWLFYNRLKNDMNAKFEKVDSRFEKIDVKMDQLDKDIKELRTSINRMEGAFYSKECCMLSDDRQTKKAE